jgi:hypothetical protein
MLRPPARTAVPTARSVGAANGRRDATVATRRRGRSPQSPPSTALAARATSQPDAPRRGLGDLQLRRADAGRSGAGAATRRRPRSAARSARAGRQRRAGPDRPALPSAPPRAHLASRAARAAAPVRSAAPVHSAAPVPLPQEAPTAPREQEQAKEVREQPGPEVGAGPAHRVQGAPTAGRRTSPRRPPGSRDGRTGCPAPVLRKERPRPPAGLRPRDRRAGRAALRDASTTPCGRRPSRR